MTTEKQRLISLDIFRGFTIIFMTLVNNPGDWSYVLPPFRHAEWHGCTPTDLIFPFFLFIMGTAMAFSLGKKLEKGHAPGPLYLKVVKRSVLLILIGVLISAFPFFRLGNVRLPGVLQRIGLCYLAASFIVIPFKRRGIVTGSVLILLSYWLAMQFIPFPGKGETWALGANFAQYLDNVLLKGHLWRPDFDPEGLFSSLPAVVNVLLGYLAGQWLRSVRGDEEKTIGLFMAGAWLSLGGWMLTYVIPLNKQLWTPSYVIFTTGIALVFLALCYWLFDVKNVRRFTRPFVIYGRNAIVAYVGSYIMAKALFTFKLSFPGGFFGTPQQLVVERLFNPCCGPWLGSFMWALFFIVSWWGILAVMNKKNIMIKL